MQSQKTGMLRVPGARLHHEVRGSGPVLLLICGGVYDAAGYAALADRLSDRYTVVTYDRRGNSRSPLERPPEAQRIEDHGDDAYRVLSAVAGDEPAYIFGNSSGAIIGLELAIRHPKRVRALVAHEPPLFDLLPDRDHWRTVIDAVEDAFATEGPDAAGQVLNAALGMGGGQPAGEPERVPGGAPYEPDPETVEMIGRLAENMTFFLGYEVPPFARYSPDLAALRASGTRVVAAAGDASVGEPPNRAAFALAERLGTLPIMFPGDHGGFGQRVEEFAAKLHQALSAA